MEIIIFAILFIVLEGFYFSTMKKIPQSLRNKIFAILVFFQLFIPAALRHVDVYNDSLAYATHFKNIMPNAVFSINVYERFEVGYQILENFVFLKISKSPVALFIITSFFIQLSYIIFFYRFSKAFWFSIFLYLGLTHYFFTVSGIRQGIAIAVFNFAFIFLINKRWIWYCLIVILAAQFHSSAYLLLCMPLLHMVRLSKKTLMVFILVILFNYLFLGDILDVFFSFFPNYGTDYLGKEMISESKTGLYLILGTYFVGLLVIIKNFDFKNYSHSEKYMLFFYIALVMFLVLSIKISILIRYTYYFIPVSIIILTNSCFKIKNIVDRAIMYGFWIILLTIQIMIILTYRPDWFMVTPYKFYWD